MEIKVHPDLIYWYKKKQRQTYFEEDLEIGCGKKLKKIKLN